MTKDQFRIMRGVYGDDDWEHFEFELQYERFPFAALWIKNKKWIFEISRDGSVENKWGKRTIEDIDIPFLDFVEFYKKKIQEYKQDESELLHRCRKNWCKSELTYQINEEKNLVLLFKENLNFGVIDMENYYFDILDRKSENDIGRKTWIFEPDAFLNFLEQVRKEIENTAHNQENG